LQAIFHTPLEEILQVTALSKEMSIYLGTNIPPFLLVQILNFLPAISKQEVPVKRK
jgi:hypothetical protein